MMWPDVAQADSPLKEIRRLVSDLMIMIQEAMQFLTPVEQIQ